MYMCVCIYNLAGVVASFPERPKEYYIYTHIHIYKPYICTHMYMYKPCRSGGLVSRTPE